MSNDESYDDIKILVHHQKGLSDQHHEMFDKRKESRRLMGLILITSKTSIRMIFMR